MYLGGKKDSLRGKMFWQVMYNLKMWWLVVSKKIDIGFGTSITLPQVSRLTQMKSIVLDDDDDAVEPLFVLYSHTFANVVLSPACTVRATKKTFHIMVIMNLLICIQTVLRQMHRYCRK